MNQYLFSNRPILSQKKPSEEKLVSQSSCEQVRNSCHEITESKIKLSVLNLKLWIVTSVVMFLVGTGSTFVCGIRSYAKIEERVDTISSNQKSLETIVDSLRKEIWKLSPYKHPDLIEDASNMENVNENIEINETRIVNNIP